MTGDRHVRFCESRGVRLPPATFLNAGRVPPRVDARVKAGLLDLVQVAVGVGWSARRAAARLGVDDARLDRWLDRRAAGALADRSPGGTALHGLLDAERAAIVAL